MMLSQHHSDSRSYSEIPPPAPPLQRGSMDLRPITPTPERRMESFADSKVGKGGS